MTRTACFIPAVMVAVVPGAWAGAGDVPATLSHSGVIAVRGERFTGVGEFRFALVNTVTGEYLWVNDDSAVTPPDAPTDPVRLPVVNGVYQVLIGDSALDGMTDLPPALFSENQAVALRVFFDDGKGGGVHALTPDTPVTTAPYARYSSTSSRLNLPGTDTTAVGVDGVGNVHVIKRLEVDVPTLVVNDLTNRVGIGTPLPGAELDVIGSMMVDATTLVVDAPANRVGIGTAAPAATLDVMGTTRTATMQITNASGPGLAPPGTVVAFAGSSPPTGWLLCNGATVDRVAFAELFAAVGTSWGNGNGSTTFHLPDLRGRFVRGVDGGIGRDPEAAGRTASNSGGNSGNAVGSVQLSATKLPNTTFTTSTIADHGHGININSAGSHTHTMLAAGTHSHAHSCADDDGGGSDTHYTLGDSDAGRTCQMGSAGSHTHTINSAGSHSHTAGLAPAGGHNHTVSAGGDLESRPINAYMNWIIKH